MQKSDSPTTAFELAFLRELGSHSDQGKAMPRADLLRGYLAGCAKRNVWGGVAWCRETNRFGEWAIDREKVMAYAKKLLEVENDRIL